MSFFFMKTILDRRRKESLGNTVKKIIRSQSFHEIEITSENQRLEDDLRVDDIDRQKITSKLEEVFKISIPGNISDGWETVADIIRTVSAD